MGFDSDTFKFGNHPYFPSLAKMERRGGRFTGCDPLE